jgi:hypothetical protein
VLSIPPMVFNVKELIWSNESPANM